jgi:hypothetical protein
LSLCLNVHLVGQDEPASTPVTLTFVSEVNYFVAIFNPENLKIWTWRQGRHCKALTDHLRALMHT